MCEPCTPDALLEAVRGLRVADPELGFKPLLAKLRAHQPDLGAATKEVREALNVLKAESEAKTAPPAPEKSGAPSHAVQSLADLLGGRSQVWLLRPQLGEQRLEAEVGIGYSQRPDGPEQGIGRAGLAHATRVRAHARRAPRRKALFWQK